LTQVILDTDLGMDCDDAGALLILLRLAEAGKCELLAVTHCTSNPHGVMAIDAIARYYGHVLPFGTLDRPGFLAEGLRYSEVIANEFPHGSGYPVALSTCIRALELAKTGVTVAAIGPLINIAELVNDPRGLALLKEKRARLVAMGGFFDKTHPVTKDMQAEWNFEMDPAAASDVMRLWPGEIVLAPFEAGATVFTGEQLRGNPKSPVYRAYEVFTRANEAVPRGKLLRSSWDPICVYFAVMGGDRLFTLSGYGTVTVDTVTGASGFTADTDGRHRFIRNTASDSEIAASLERWMEP